MCCLICRGLLILCLCIWLMLCCIGMCGLCSCWWWCCCWSGLLKWCVGCLCCCCNVLVVVLVIDMVGWCGMYFDEKVGCVVYIFFIGFVNVLCGWLFRFGCFFLCEENIMFCCYIDCCEFFSVMYCLVVIFVDFDNELLEVVV